MSTVLHAKWKPQLKALCAAVAVVFAASVPIQSATACTGVTLIAEDGAVIFGRTEEWGTFDLNSRLAIVPRGYQINTELPDGKQGLSWQTKFGFVGVDALNKDLLIDGMNEKGLTANLFYHEGFAKYADYDPKKSANSVPILALAPYLLSNFTNTDEVRAALAKIAVVGVYVEAIGGEPPVHIFLTDSRGKAIVVEFTQGVTKVHEAPLGVVTNGPNYDWHMNNLLNYVNLDEPLPHRHAKDIKAIKFGAGERLYGLPGDLTSPSRFLRAAAYASSARKTADGPETLYEIFRVLDNFNLTVGTAAEGGGEVNQQGMRSSTIWTTAYDTKNLVMHYHTMHNRRVRELDFNSLDFDAKAVVRLPLDREKTQDIEKLIPPKI